MRKPHKGANCIKIQCEPAEIVAGQDGVEHDGLGPDTENDFETEFRVACRACAPEGRHASLRFSSDSPSKARVKPGSSMV
ncbi:MAG: hypothetical protein NT061_08040 [Spirochaetes bacterium]|nr:hypothetical protein [Spirochaetota bacterium]